MSRKIASNSKDQDEDYNRIKVKIRNIYYMLSYAYRIPLGSGLDNLSKIKLKNIHDLFAALLAQGVGVQIKRGLHRDYVEREEELAGVRGQIRVGETIKQLSHIKGKLVCAFDEFCVDTPHNQALKSVMNLLLRRGDVEATNKDSLRKRLLFFDEVSDILPTSINWDAMKFHRNNASYIWLMNICRLVVEGLIHTEKEKGTHKLHKWLPYTEMKTIYEKFVLGYYKTHYPSLNAFPDPFEWKANPKATKSGIDKNKKNTVRLPSMITDITLKYEGNNKKEKLIIDTKFRPKTKISHIYHDNIYIREHLFQIFAYVKNDDEEGKWNVSGLLLYAKAPGEDNSSDADFRLCDNNISLKTLDLNKKWRKINKQLDKIIKRWLGIEGTDVDEINKEWPGLTEEEVKRLIGHHVISGT